MNINEVVPHAGEYINRRNNCFHVCLFQSWVSSLDIKYWVISNADSPHVLGIQRCVLTGSFIRLGTSGYYYQHCWLCYFCLVRNLFTLFYIIIKRNVSEILNIIVWRCYPIHPVRSWRISDYFQSCEYPSHQSLSILEKVYGCSDLLNVKLITHHYFLFKSFCYFIYAAKSNFSLISIVTSSQIVW